jgi:NADH:ubiquinone oxidoreductase subunit E
MTFEELEQIAESTRAEYAKYDHEINVCMGTGCLSQHSDQLKDALAKAVADQGKNVFVRRTGCMGLCAAGPLVLVDPEEILSALQSRQRRDHRCQSRRRARGRAAMQSARALRPASPRRP